jgi:hypothetical protein
MRYNYFMINVFDEYDEVSCYFQVNEVLPDPSKFFYVIHQNLLIESFVWENNRVIVKRNLELKSTANIKNKTERFYYKISNLFLEPFSQIIQNNFHDKVELGDYQIVKTNYNIDIEYDTDNCLIFLPQTNQLIGRFFGEKDFDSRVLISHAYIVIVPVINKTPV